MYLNRKDLFTFIYQQNLWLSNESKSGFGSELKQTEKVIEFINYFMKNYNISTIADLACGDFNWQQYFDFSLIEKYYGIDIVSNLIDENNKKFAQEKIEFLNLDILDDSLPKVDLILCRDCLVHYSFAEIDLIIKNIIASKPKYFITTSFQNLKVNSDIITGKWRPLNFDLQPFNFPKPLLVFLEGCTEFNGLFKDKSLCVWSLNY